MTGPTWGGDGGSSAGVPAPPPQQPYGGGPVDPYGGQPAYPVPYSHPYVNPGSWEPAQYFGGARPAAGAWPPGPAAPREPIPGALIGGTVVGYLLGAFLFVTGLFLVFAGSVVGAFDDVDDVSGPALLVAGIGNWAAAAFLVTGGIMASVRKPTGLVVSLAGAALVVVLAVYWLVLYADDTTVVWAVIHVAIALVCAGLLALPARNRSWLSSAPTPAPAFPPAGPHAPPPYPLDEYGRPFGS